MYCLMISKVVNGIHTFTPFRYSDDLEYLQDVFMLNDEDYVIVKLGEIVYKCY